MTTNTYKIIGEACLVPAMLLLSSFTFGEVFAGDISGLQHLVQLLPLIGVAVLAWQYPRLGGRVLIWATLLLLTLYLIGVARFSPIQRLINAIVIFGPSFVGSYFFTRASRIPLLK